MRSRPVVRFRPDLESFETKCLLSAVARVVPAGRLALGSAHPVFPIFHGVPTPHGVFALEPDSGVLVAPFVQVRAEPAAPIPGAVYNVALLTVRNGTAQTFGAASGFSVRVSGSSRGASFPLGTAVWKPGQVLVLYSLTQTRFPPNFTIGLPGGSTEKPANLYYNVQYNPNTFPGLLNSLVATRVVGDATGLSPGDRFVPLCEHSADNFAGDVGEPEVAAAVAIRQLLVIKAHQVQDRRVQIVDVDA